MNSGERMAANYFESQGWQVVGRGWPDLCLFRPGDDGKMKLKLVEVKRDNRDQLRKEQNVLHSLLRGAGLEVETVLLSDLPTKGTAYEGISTFHDYLKQQPVSGPHLYNAANAAWHECLATGLIPGAVERWGAVRMQTSDFIEWAKARGYYNISPQQIGLLWGENTRGSLMGMGFKKLQDEEHRYWSIPPLPAARSLWDKLRFIERWPKDGGSWDTLFEMEVL